jgi:hypothetical protein
MKYLVLIPLILSLGACAGNPTIISHENVAVSVDEKMYRCPQVDRLPNPDTLTDSQVAKLLVHLQVNNKICYNSINTLKIYMINAQNIINKRKGAN